MTGTQRFRHTTGAVILLALLAGVISPERVSAQEGDWNGRKAAVILTYDDALESHLDIVVPLLNDHGHRATFYVTGVFPGFTPNIERWRAAAADGHELAITCCSTPAAKPRGGAGSAMTTI